MQCPEQACSRAQLELCPAGATKALKGCFLQRWAQPSQAPCLTWPLLGPLPSSALCNKPVGNHLICLQAKRSPEFQYFRLCIPSASCRLAQWRCFISTCWQNGSSIHQVQSIPCKCAFPPSTGSFCFSLSMKSYTEEFWLRGRWALPPWWHWGWQGTTDTLILLNDHKYLFFWLLSGALLWV